MLKLAFILNLVLPKDQAMRLSPILLFSVLLTFIACSGDKPQQVQAIGGKKNINVPHVMDLANMYDTTAINTALLKADRHQKTESRKLFLQGLDLLVNKNKPAESVELFKESILFYPDEKNYLHLFKAYIYSSDTTNAERLAEFINTQAPKWGLEYYEIDFNYALIAAVKKDTNSVLSTLSDALMNGFVFKDRITEEPLFKFLDNSFRYQSFIANNFGSDEKLNRILFKALIAYFPDLELPYAIMADSARSFSYDKYIDYNYAIFIPDMEDGRFARDVTNEYMYVGKTKLENGYAFVYKSFLAIADTLNPVKTFIVTYDSVGTRIANEMIGCFCSPTESKSFVINKDLSINITEFTTNWETDPLESGYANNKIISTTESAKVIMVIDKDGTLSSRKEEVVTNATAKN
jgi:hypothetical protein